MFFKIGRRTAHSGKLDLSRVPKHIGIIMDGNGRWAKRRGLPRRAGHKAGADNLERICDYCNSIGVKALTVYAFSTENWNRPKDEVDALMELLYNYLLTVKDAIVHAEEVTSSGDGLVLNIALNYGGRAEIVNAARLAAAAVSERQITVEDITEEYFGGLMYTSNLPEVDLIIRPSGEKRLSNFLLWQAAYAEFWYSDICWPDFTNKDMEQAIIDYQNRDRRFGRI